MGTVPLDRPQGATPEEPSPCLAPAQTRQNHTHEHNLWTLGVLLRCLPLVVIVTISGDLERTSLVWSVCK